MGKENRRKAHQQKTTDFPFRLLNYWIKPCRELNEGDGCVCGNDAMYIAEHYTDDTRMFRLQEQGLSQIEAINQVWNQALTEQLKGHYTKYSTSLHCEKCIMRMVEAMVGKNAAQLTMMPMMLLGSRGSIILGNELETVDDDGLPFSSFTHVETIEDLARQLRGKAVPIHLKQ